MVFLNRCIKFEMNLLKAWNAKLEAANFFAV